MAPKRKVSETKQDLVASDSLDNESDQGTSLTSLSRSDDDQAIRNGKTKKKKPKAEKKPKMPVVPLDPNTPINTVIPIEMKFERAADGVIRISTWNVCGLKACDRKGFRHYVTAEDADILVLQETKSGEPLIDDLSRRYEYRYWGVDPKKGYAGCAILSKIKPLQVSYGLPGAEIPQIESEGRLVLLEFESTYLIGTYVPNAGNGLKTLDKKEAWNKAFETYLRKLDAKKPVIWTGDINCVQTTKDIRNWKTNYNKSAGCTDQEINGLNAQLNPSPSSGHKPLVDVWRRLHPDLEGHYSYYSYKFQCRVKGIGWRLDTFITSERIVNKVRECEIRLEVWGASDHVPVVLDFVGPL